MDARSKALTARPPAAPGAQTCAMDVAFAWVALGVIPVVLTVSVVLAVLLARSDQER